MKSSLLILAASALLIGANTAQAANLGGGLWQSQYEYRNDRNDPKPE